MPININSSFLNQTPTFLDARESVKNLDELKSINLNIIPDGFEVYVKSENCKYKYLSSNDNTDSSGKWKKIANVLPCTKEKYNAIETKDENTTYIVTDEDNSEIDISDIIIDDNSTTSKSKTYSVNKIINLLTNWQDVTLNETVSNVTVKKLKIGNIVYMHTHINGLAYTGQAGMGTAIFSTSDSDLIKPSTDDLDRLRGIIDVDDIADDSSIKRMHAVIDYHLKTGEFKFYCTGESTQELNNVNLYGDIFSIIYQ